MLLRLAAAMILLASPALTQEYKIRTDVNLVVLSAAVTDGQGRHVPGLRKENFGLREDDNTQEITLFAAEDAPVTVGLVVDSSASMRPKRAATVAAALAFVQSSNPADEIFVVNFNEKVQWGLPPSIPFSGDPSLLTAALRQSSASGRTALYDAIAAGLAHLSRGAHDRKALVVFSDGGDNSSRSTFDQTLDLVQHSDATVYTIGLFDDHDDDRNPGVLKRLAKVTGGAAFLPGGAMGIDQICRQIARDLRSRYTLGYVPSPTPKAGFFRKIRVTAAAPGYGKLFVRTRSGYLAAGAGPPSREGGPL